MTILEWIEVAKKRRYEPDYLLKALNEIEVLVKEGE